jgi:hypothetical protein
MPVDLAGMADKRDVWEILQNWCVTLLKDLCCTISGGEDG